MTCPLSNEARDVIKTALRRVPKPEKGDGKTILKSYATATVGSKAGVEMEIKKKNEAKIINLSGRITHLKTMS